MIIKLNLRSGKTFMFRERVKFPDFCLTFVFFIKFPEFCLTIFNPFSFPLTFFLSSKPPCKNTVLQFLNARGKLTNCRVEIAFQVPGFIIKQVFRATYVDSGSVSKDKFPLRHCSEQTVMDANKQNITKHKEQGSSW